GELFDGEVVQEKDLNARPIIHLPARTRQRQVQQSGAGERQTGRPFVLLHIAYLSTPSGRSLPRRNRSIVPLTSTQGPGPPRPRVGSGARWELVRRTRFPAPSAHSLRRSMLGSSYDDQGRSAGAHRPRPSSPSPSRPVVRRYHERTRPVQTH